MAFWIVLPVLALLAVAFVAVPLLRARTAESSPSAPTTSEGTPLTRLNRTAIWLGLGLGVVVVVPAVALYAFVGRPDLAAVEARVDTASQGGQPGSATPAGSMTDMISELRGKVQKSPNDAGAWQTLGWAYMHIRRPKDAIEAYKHAVSLAPDNAESLSALAEATIQSGSGQILGATVADLKKVVAIDPSDARARFYLALYKDQQGNHRGAIADWITLLKSAPAGAGWAPEVRRVVEQVAKEQKLDVSGQLPPAPAVEASQTEMAPGPNAAQIAAASQMSGSDRDSMIHSMVDQLAKELHQNPHDAGGWVRLIRARMVLGQKAEADAAYHSARDAFSDDPSQLATIDQTARSLGVADR